MSAPLPPAYAWLSKEIPLPRMVAEALKLFGTVETAGAKNNPVIMGWAAEVGLAKVYSADAVPWCGLFMAVVAKRAGKDVVKDPLWARNWAKFGRTLNDTEAASLGDVLVFVRDGGGHVGLYVGEDAVAYHVLGGNQSDKVCFTRIAKTRCVAVRRPLYNLAPATVRPRKLGASGSLSVNEA